MCKKLAYLLPGTGIIYCSTTSQKDNYWESKPLVPLKVSTGFTNDSLVYLVIAMQFAILSFLLRFSFSLLISWQLSSLSSGPAWGAWGALSPCSVTCGQGQQTRTRVCLKSQNNNQVEACVGDSVQTFLCSMPECVTSELVGSLTLLSLAYFHLGWEYLKIA